MNLQDRRDLIVSSFHDAWKLNDRAHRFSHFSEVEECGLHINKTLVLGFDPKLILLVAFFHDLFAHKREVHHQLSADFVLGSNHEAFADLTLAERHLVADGCREHRATFRGPFSSAFTQLMSAADRGFPGKVDEMLERAIQYRVDRGTPEDEARPGAVAHLKEKFGTGGYALYPRLYEQAFGKDLARQRKVIDNL